MAEATQSRGKGRSVTHAPMNDDESPKPSTWTKRMSKRLRKTASRVGMEVRKLRKRLVLLLLLPGTVSFLLCWISGMGAAETLQLLFTLATISGCFACFYDTLSQFSEAAYRAKSGTESESIWSHFREHYDGWRTVRYAGVHFVYNGPYHMPKLLFLNWMYPGTPTPSIAWHKWLWATFLFSPGESFGVLSGVQIMRDGGRLDSVLPKLMSDGPTFQLTKWVGHAIPHYLSFLTTTDVVSLYMYNFAFKAAFEIILSFLAARPVKNKADITAYTHIPAKGELIEPEEVDATATAAVTVDEESPLGGEGGERQVAGYGTINQ